MPKITPFLWFDKEAEEAAKFYVALFPNSKILNTSYYPEGSPGPAGSVMVVDFELDGQRFNALNGGPVFQFNEAVSFVIDCKDQAEVDHYWDALSEGGHMQQCGWLKDKYGVMWQVVPRALNDLMNRGNEKQSQAVMQVLMQMKKLDVAELQKAYDEA